jgi:hypothetical protein
VIQIFLEEKMSTFLGQNRNHGRRHDKRAESEEDYHTFVTRLEKKTSMIEGPYFGNFICVIIA